MTTSPLRSRSLWPSLLWLGGWLVVVPALVSLGDAPRARAELRAVIVFGGDRSDIRLAWLTALCNTYKALVSLIPEANIVLFTRTAPGELNRICGNDMEEKVLYVNPSFNKRGLLDAIRFYAFNHNLILLLMGHGLMPRDTSASTDSDSPSQHWEGRITDAEAQKWNVSLAAAHSDHVDMARTLSPLEFAKRGLYFFDFVRAKFLSNLPPSSLTTARPTASKPDDAAAILRPQINTAADLPPLTAAQLASFKVRLAPNAFQIGALKIEEADYQHANTTVQDDLLLTGADLMSLGQPWYNLILLPFFSYGGGLMDQFADTVQKKAVWVYSPTLAYHELEPSHASDLAVSLIKSIILSKRGWATVYNFMTNFTDTCNAFYSSQKVAVFQVRRCLVMPGYRTTLVLPQSDGTLRATWAWANWNLLSQTYFYQTVTNYARQPVTIWIKLKTGKSWKKMIVAPDVTLANFIKQASTTLNMLVWDKFVFHNFLDPTQFRIVCFVKDSEGSFIEIDWLLLRSLRERSNVQCNTPFTPDFQKDSTVDFSSVSST